MNKLLTVVGSAGVALAISGCTMVDAQVYDGPVQTDYVYAVSYYPNGIPNRYQNRYYYNRSMYSGASYWNSSTYYNGYGAQPNAYWGTYDYYTNY